jgi:hypothetical protein
MIDAILFLAIWAPQWLGVGADHWAVATAEGRTMSDVRERLAEYAHEAWAAYMDYFLDRCEPTVDGWLIPISYVKALRKQIATDYADLSWNDQESDLAEADKMIAIVQAVQE